MSGLQVFVGLFGLAALAVSIVAVWKVATKPEMGYRPLWIAGCLFGFVGFSLDWSSPGDLYLELGVQIPVVLVWFTASGATFVQALFPVVAVVALVRMQTH